MDGVTTENNWKAIEKVPLITGCGLTFNINYYEKLRNNTLLNLFIFYY